MLKIKKFLIIPAVMLAAALALSGCFADFGGAQPQQTNPPEQVFKSTDEFTKAVAAAKADTAAPDEQNLKGLTRYYDLQKVPEGATLDYIKVSTLAVRVGYKFGETSEQSFDNRMEFVWYRNVSTSDYLSNVVKGLTDYDTLSLNGVEYLHTSPDISYAVTPAPGDTAAATPTPRVEKYCQFLYWVQDDAALVCAVPLGFTNEDIGKYCVGVKKELN